jgi:hypothetical protein
MLWIFVGIGPAPGILFAALFVISFFCLGLIALLTGPIATESAPAGLVSPAVGIVVGACEILAAASRPRSPALSRNTTAFRTFSTLHSVAWDLA